MTSHTTTAPTGRPAPVTPAAQLQPTAAQKQTAAPVSQATLAPAQEAEIESRHRLIGLSFIVLVLIPMLSLTIYLWGFAKDQYASYVGFAVRSEAAAQPLEVLGGLTGLSSSSSSDPEVLYKFIRSHALVQAVDEQLDLRSIWSKAEFDPLYTYHGDHKVEDLLDHWNRKVAVTFDDGMLDVRVSSFAAEDSQRIAQVILDESQKMINDLNDIAREDAIRYAREELGRAVERLKTARQAVTEFRDKYQLVDPTADVEGQLGILAELKKQLAEAVIGLELLKSNSRSNDPRVQQQELRIKVIEERIAVERRKFGGSSESGEQLSSVVGEYERLAVDRQFAETAYIAALAAFDTAQADATRTSRYLAAYTKPTLAETAEYPKRMRVLATWTFFVLLSWTVGVLIYYSIRNRR